MRRLVLLRHGLTSWNAERRFQGHADLELTETGHAQAAAAAAVIAAYEPAQLWSSDLARTVQTAEYVAEATQLVPRLDERLREIQVGAFQGLTHDEAVGRHGAGPWVYADHGGETDAEVADRFVAALDDVVADLGPDETAVVVSHGYALRVGLARLLGWTAEGRATLASLDNCGWIELVDEPSRWASPVPWRLAAYNRVAPIS